MSTKFAACVVLIVFSASFPEASAATDSPDTIYVDGKPCSNFCRAWLGLPLYPGLEANSVNRFRRANLALLDANTKKRNFHPTLLAKQAVLMPQPRPPRALQPKSADGRSDPVAAGPSTKPTSIPRQSATAPSSIAELPPSIFTPALSVNRQKEVEETPATEATGSQAVHKPVTKPLSAPEQPTKLVANSDSKETPSRGAAFAAGNDAPTKPNSLPLQNAPSANVDQPLRETPSIATGPNVPAAPKADGRVAAMSMSDPTAHDQTSTAPVIKAASQVAIVITKGGVQSIAGLNKKSVAVGDKYVSKRHDIQSSLAAAGANDVQLSGGAEDALARLIHGEVDGAVLAVVSPSAAETFPEFAGYRIFRIRVSN